MPASFRYEPLPLAPLPQPLAVPAWGSLLLALWWLLSFVDSAWPQFQMAMFGNYVLFGMWPIHLLLLSTGAVMLMRAGIPEVPRDLLLWWAAFGAYLVLSLIFLEARYEGSFGSLATTFYRFYFLPMVLPLAFALPGGLNSRHIQVTLLIIFIPLGALGLRQYFINDPILPTAAINGTFQVFAWWFQGDIRAFSLFNSGWSFGHFAVFIGVLALWRYYFRADWTPLLSLAYLAAAALCVYYCLTRTVYLVGMGSLFAAIWLQRARRLDHFAGAQALPLLFAFCGYMVARGIKDVLRMLGIGDDGIFNAGSLDIRKETWDAWTGVWLDQGLSNALFGAAVSQRDSGQLLSESTVLIDNVFITIGVQIGMVGVLIWIGFMWAVWALLLREAKLRDEPLIWAIAAVWATWPLSLMFGSGGAYYMLLAILALITREKLQPSDADEDSVAADEPALLEVTQQRLRNQLVPEVSRVGIVGHEQVDRTPLQR